MFVFSREWADGLDRWESMAAPALLRSLANPDTLPGLEDYDIAAAPVTLTEQVPLKVGKTFLHLEELLMPEPLTTARAGSGLGLDVGGCPNMFVPLALRRMVGVGTATILEIHDVEISRARRAEPSRKGRLCTTTRTHPTRQTSGGTGEHRRSAGRCARLRSPHEALNLLTSG